MNYQNKFKKHITYSIDYNDLDSLIKKVYDVDVESCLDQSNDSTLFISVDGILSRFDQTDLEVFLSTEIQEYNTLRLLLNDMCRKNLIEPGQYLVNISW